MRKEVLKHSILSDFQFFRDENTVSPGISKFQHFFFFVGELDIFKILEYNMPILDYEDTDEFNFARYLGFIFTLSYSQR